MADGMDVELFYEEKGQGLPFIFLHGNGEDGSYFKNQTEYFKNKYRTIAVDSRGHGKSPRGTAPLSIGQFSRDLYDFMNLLGIPSAIILGFSDGANVAMTFAMNHPKMVKALILNGGNLCPEGVKRSTQFPIEIGYKIAKHFAKKVGKSRKKCRNSWAHGERAAYRAERIIENHRAYARRLRHAGYDQRLAHEVDRRKYSECKTDHFKG